MPHKPTKRPKAGAVDQVRTLAELARSLGRTDDTITQWRRRGMPAGPEGRGPYSVVAVYLWAQAQGLAPAMPADPAIAALIRRGSSTVRAPAPPPADTAPATAPTGSDDRPDAPTTLPGRSAYDAMLSGARPESYREALEREKLIGEEIANEVRRTDLARARGALVTREQATAAAAAIRDRFSRAGHQLPQDVVARLPADLPLSTREAVATAITTAWEQVLASVVVG